MYLSFPPNNSILRLTFFSFASLKTAMHIQKFNIILNYFETFQTILFILKQNINSIIYPFVLYTFIIKVLFILMNH